MQPMSSDVWFSTFPPSCGSAPPPQQCLLAAAAGSFCRITRNDLLGCELWLDNSEQHLWASSLNVPRMSQPAQPNEWHNAWIWWTNYFFSFSRRLSGILVFQKYSTLNLTSHRTNWDPIYSLSPPTRGPLLVDTSDAFKSLPPHAHYSGVTSSGRVTATVCSRL